MLLSRFPLEQRSNIDQTIIIKLLMTHTHSLCVLTAIFQLNLACPVLLELRTMEAVVTAGAIKHAKLQTNQHPTLFTGRMPFLSPNEQSQSTKGKTVYICKQ